jgi:hypothetical protein
MLIPATLIEEVIETARRPGLLGLAGKRIEKRCRTDLETYFSALGREILNLHLEQTVAHATKEVALHAVELKVANVLRHRQPILKAIFEQNLADAMLSSDNIDPFAEATQPSPPEPPLIPPFEIPPDEQLDYVGLTAQQAAAWAEEYAAELVTGIDATTMQQIQDAIARGITEQLGTEGTARLIQDLMDGMTRERARTIARTETNSAMGESSLQKLTRLGLYKRWVCGPNPCEICQENENAGAIPVDEYFPSGDLRPSAHPNDACALVGARPPESVQ